MFAQFYNSTPESIKFQYQGDVANYLWNGATGRLFAEPAFGPESNELTILRENAIRSRRNGLAFPGIGLTLDRDFFSGGVVMKKRTVLYVDDDQALADMVRETLEHAGFDVVTDTDSRRALRTFTKDICGYDLVILDHLMPGMEGLDLARWLLLNRVDLPVTLVTGHPDMVSFREAERAGVREVLFKPLTRPELFAAIDRALSPAHVMRVS